LKLGSGQGFVYFAQVYSSLLHTLPMMFTPQSAFDTQQADVDVTAGSLSSR
jgi:hypothetical protein